MNREHVKLSIKLSKLLRHTATKRNLNIDESGWILLDDILKLNEFNKFNFNDIVYVVENNDKKRFSLRFYNNIYYLRANQGHSIKLNNNFLKEIKDIEYIKNIVHGTFAKNLKSIKENGLCRMKRNHIHFAREKNLMFGLRKNSEVYIGIDVINAIKDDIKFYESDNKVILSPGIGDKGIIPFKYLIISYE